MGTVLHDHNMLTNHRHSWSAGLSEYIDINMLVGTLQ